MSAVTPAGGARIAGPSAAVLVEVAAERNRQNAKWGVQNHEPFVWLAILMEEVGEASEATLGDGKPRDYRKEMIEVAAVAVAAIESFDRALSLTNGPPNTEDGEIVSGGAVMDAKPYFVRVVDTVADKGGVNERIGPMSLPDALQVAANAKVLGYHVAISPASGPTNTKDGES